MFLTKEELKTKATSETINLIVSDETTVNEIINECIDVMKGYMHSNYDTDAIFSAVDNARSKTVLRHLKALVIVDIYEIRKKTPSESMDKKYDEAMRWLEHVSAGKIQPQLPLLNVDTNGDGQVDGPETFLKLGSRKTYQNHF